MMKKLVSKKIIFSSLLASILVPIGVSAAVTGPTDTVLTLLNNTLTIISKFFAMEWAFQDPQIFMGFLRFMLWLTTFIIMYGAGQGLFSKMFADNAKAANRTASTIAVVIATMTALFVPPSVLIGWGETYAVVVMFLFIAAPIGGLLWLAYAPKGIAAAIEPGWGLRIIRIIMILLAWEITHLITTWGDAFGSIGGASAAIPVVIIPIIGFALIKRKNGDN